MKSIYDERSLKFAHYIIDNNATVRDTAKKFGISKSTVHKDITVRLPETDKVLSGLVKNVLEKNKSERHIRGGEATKLKYRLIHDRNC